MSILKKPRPRKQTIMVAQIHATIVPQGHLPTLSGHGHDGLYPTELAPLQHHTIIEKIHYRYNLDNYKPITFANAFYKLWTSSLAVLATDYIIEGHKNISPEQ